jgi:hypothetical protein
VVAVPVGNKSAVDALLAFDPPGWAADYSGTWLSPVALLITAHTVPSINRTDPAFRASTAVGMLQVSVLRAANLTSLDGTSAPCNASTVVAEGSWGDVVCDGGLFVLSAEALVVGFAPPPVTAPSSPLGYTLTVFTPSLNASDTVDVEAAEATAASFPALALPPSVPLRVLLTALAPDVPVTVHVAVWVPQLPLAVSHNLPRAVAPLTWPLGGDGGCVCTAAATGVGCRDVPGLGQALAPAGPVIST